MTLWRFDPIRQCFDSRIAGFQKRQLNQEIFTYSKQDIRTPVICTRLLSEHLKAKKYLAFQSIFRLFPCRFNACLNLFFIAGILLTSEVKEKTTLTMN